MKSLPVAACILILHYLTGCTSLPASNAGCLGCHKAIEHVSASHPDCVACHGGNGVASSKAEGHRGMLGGGNPSAPATWEKSCGRCHMYQLGRTTANIMFTNSGMIRNIQLTWGETADIPYGTQGEKTFGPDGKPLTLAPVSDLDSLGGELYRKTCSRCHIGSQNDDAYGAVHGSGCSTCHFPFNDTGTYRGKDATMYGRGGYAESHAMAALPPMQACSRCHNRSGRIALSYQGLYDGNNGLVPTSNGEPGPVMLSGLRNAGHITPDIHFERGMECIDCHTSRDVMGDGFAYRNMYLQTEIACEDCHGGATPPRTEVIGRENDESVRESRGYRLPMRPGMRMVLTAKGRKYSNVFLQDGKIMVQGKRSGRLFTSKVITGTAEHSVVGHGRLECFACHSRTVVQCFGCHTAYDKGVKSMDYIRGEETPGAFSESEDFRKLYPFPLAVNQRGRISPVTPGCQTFVTVRNGDGTTALDEAILQFKGQRQLRFAPFFSHNTGVRAVGCSECHGNPAFLGFGQHVVAGGDIEATLICERSADKPLDGFLTMTDGRVSAHAAITREHARPLAGGEVRRTLAVNLCIVCHERANDPIYRRSLNYRALDDVLHRRLLADP